MAQPVGLSVERDSKPILQMKPPGLVVILVSSSNVSILIPRSQGSDRVLMHKQIPQSPFPLRAKYLHRPAWWC